MKTKEFLFLTFLIFSLHGCGILGIVTEQALDSAIENTKNKKLHDEEYGKMTIIESKMDKVDSTMSLNRKLIVISGKLKFTTGSYGGKVVYFGKNSFTYRFLDSKNKQIYYAISDGDIIFNSDVDRMRLELNTIYDFKARFCIPIDEWNAITNYKFDEFENLNVIHDSQLQRFSY